MPFDYAGTCCCKVLLAFVFNRCSACMYTLLHSYCCVVLLTLAIVLSGTCFCFPGTSIILVLVIAQLIHAVFLLVLVAVLVVLAAVMLVLAVVRLALVTVLLYIGCLSVSTRSLSAWTYCYSCINCCSAATYCVTVILI